MVYVGTPTRKTNHTNCAACGLIIHIGHAFIMQTSVLRYYTCSEKCARQEAASSERVLKRYGGIGPVIILPPPDYNASKTNEARWKPILINERG